MSFQEQNFSNLVEQYENVLLKLKEKQDRLDYLSSFFETTRQKIEAVKLKIDEDETKLKEMEDKSNLNFFQL